jgi:YggT family protein
MVVGIVTFGAVIVEFIQIFATVLTWAIIIRALLSWFSISGAQPLFRLLIEITEPVLAPIRRVLPSVGMMDISPIIAIVVINVVSQILANSLARI